MMYYPTHGESKSSRKRGSLARECAKLDPKEERALADEGLSADRDSWPEY
jgi:hypothetical protein